MRRWPSRVPSRVPLAGRTGQRAECRLPQGQHRLPRPCGPPLKSGADRSRGVLSQGPPSTAGGQGHSGATWPPVSASNSTIVATSGMGGRTVKPVRPTAAAFGAAFPRAGDFHRGELTDTSAPAVGSAWTTTLSAPRPPVQTALPRGWTPLSAHRAPLPSRAGPPAPGAPGRSRLRRLRLPRRWLRPACRSPAVCPACTRHLPQHGRLASTPLAGQAQLRGSSSRGVSAALNHSPRPRGLLLPHPRREEFRLNDRHPALLPPKCPRPGPRPPPASASLLMERGQQPSPAEQVG